MRTATHGMISLLLVGVILTCGCKEKPASSVPAMGQEERQTLIAAGRTGRRNLTNAQPDIRSAVQAFLDETRSSPAPFQPENLQTLIQEQEFKSLVWPNFPDSILSNPYINPDDEWKAERIVRVPLLAALRRHAERGRLLVLETPLRKPAEKRPNLTLHMLAPVRVKNETSGEILKIAVIGAVIEHDGQFKVAHIYTTDD